MKTTVSDMRDIYDNTSSLLDNMVTDMSSFVETVQSSLRAAQTLASQETEQEVTRLQQQNERLQQLVVEERVRGEKMRDDVVQRVSGLLGDFIADKDRRLRETVSFEAGQNEEDVASLSQFHQAHRNAIQGAVGQSEILGKGLKKRTGEVKRLRDGALKSIDGSHASVSNGLSQMRQAVGTQLHECSSDLQGRLQSMHKTSSDGASFPFPSEEGFNRLPPAFEEHSRAKRARIEVRDSVFTGIHSQYSSLRDTLTSTTNKIDGISDTVAVEVCFFSFLCGIVSDNISELILVISHRFLSNVLQWTPLKYTEIESSCSCRAGATRPALWHHPSKGRAEICRPMEPYS